LTRRYGFGIEIPLDQIIEYGKLILDQGEYEEAIKALKLASTRHPDSASSLYWLGRAYEAAGKAPEALVAYKRFLELYPHSSTMKAKVSELEKLISSQ